MDGDRNPQFNEKGCAHTFIEEDPWWKVDLLKGYDIARVTITNRGDCCSDRIQGAEIRIGDSLDNNGNNNTRLVMRATLKKGKLGLSKLLIHKAWNYANS